MELILLPILMFLGFGPWFDDADGDNPDEPSPNERTFGGDDNDVSGTAAVDKFSLGRGDDVARMGAGDDVAFGEDGDDQVTGGKGDDRIFLGDGNDQNFLTNADGNNLDPQNFAGNDLVRGGAGDDRIADFLGSNTLYGGRGADLLDGVDQSGEATSPDVLFGGQNGDALFGDGADILTGGTGFDSFSLILDEGNGEPAVITDYEAGEPLFVVVPLIFAGMEAELVQKGDDLALTLGDQTLAVLKGMSDPDDVVLFLSASDVADLTLNPDDLVYGTEGDDVLRTGGGDDAIFVGRGDDIVDAGDGDDYISLRTARPFGLEGELGWGDNTVDAGRGQDQIIGGQGDDQINGQGGRDVLIGGGGEDVLRGGSGDDRIDAFDSEVNQADRVFGGDGNDVISTDDGDTITGGAGKDTIIVEEYVKGDRVVTVTDYQPGRDMLEVSVPGGDLSVTFEARGDTTRVFVGDRPVFDLQNIQPRDISRADVRVSTYA